MYVGERGLSPSALRSLMTLWVSTSSPTTTPGHAAASSSSRVTALPARPASTIRTSIAFGSMRTVSLPRPSSLVVASAHHSPICTLCTWELPRGGATR